MLRRFKLKGKLLLSFFMITCLSSITTTLFSIHYFSDKIRSEALINMRKNIQVAHLVYRNKAENIRNIADSFAKDGTLQVLVQFAPNRVQQYLPPLMTRAQVQQLLVVDVQGGLLGQVAQAEFPASPAPLAPSTLALIQQAQTTKQALVRSERLVTAQGEWLAITAVSPILRSKMGRKTTTDEENQDDNSLQLAGAVLVRYLLNGPNSVLQEIQALLGVSTVLFQNGQPISVQAAPHDQAATLSALSLGRYQELLSTPNDTVEDSQQHYDGRLIQYLKIRDAEHTPIALLSVSMPTASYLNTVYQAMYALVGIMLACMLFAFLIGWLLARSLSVPIDKLLDGVKRVTSGDLSYSIEASSHDELGILARAFNSMSYQLNELFSTLEQRIENATQRLQDTLAHLAAIIDNMADGLLVTDLHGQIIRYNPALSAMFPLSPPATEMHCNAFDQTIAELVEKSREAQHQVHSAEIALGHERVGQVVVNAIMYRDDGKGRGADGGLRYIGTVALVRDITREKEIDRMLKDTVDTLTRIGTALSAETNLNRLLEMLVSEARRVCHADGGTLYTLEEGQLHFKIVQNDSLNIFMGGTSAHPIKLPALSLDDSKISAYTANHKIVVHSPDVYAEKRFDFFATRQYDAQMGYQTRAMLSVPLLDRMNQAVGVLQLINPLNPKTGAYCDFDSNQINIVSSLASQAAVAIENARNYTTIERKNIAFERFVPTEFIQHLGHKKVEDIQLGDATQAAMAVLFSDIRGFTSLSETMTPEESFNFLNAYLQEIGPHIVGNGGFIDKYIGDAIMALFPGYHRNTADDSVAAAIGMVQGLQRFNQQYHRHAVLPPIRIGIGIHSGPMTLGTIGFEKRMETTVIGDTVNLASRIENLTKYYGVSISISAAIYQDLSPTHGFLIREIDRVQVKGKEQAVTLYEVFDADPDTVRAGKLASLTAYQTALQQYKKGEWQAAASLFTTLQHTYPEDLLYPLYQARCQALVENPPGLDCWTGITRLTDK